MRTQTIRNVALALVALLAAAPALAKSLDGTIKLGGIFIDEEGDLSTVQETYNLYDGFTVAQLHLEGTPAGQHYMMLDVRDANLASRRGQLLYRIPARFRFHAGYDQHRQVFTADRGVTSKRRDWRAGAEWSPSGALALSSWLNYQTRDGDRIAFPPGTISALGLRYDHTLLNGQVSADLHSGGRGIAASYEASRFEDRLQSAGDRTGQVVAGRLWAPLPFYDRWTNLARGAYGQRRLTSGGIEHKIYDVQYTAVVRPVDAYEVRYAFEGRRVDDRSQDLKADRFTNDLDVVYYHPYGQLRAGAGYETFDDDRSLTRSVYLRGGAVWRMARRFSAKVDYAGRVKKDEQELTLLKDLDAYRVRGQVELQPLTGLSLGGGYTERDREFPDIHVEAMGQTWNAFTRFAVPKWWELSADYTRSNDVYSDLVAGFRTRSNIVTGRLELTRIPNVVLAGGATYFDIRRDLDIEKSTVFAEAGVTLQKDYHVEVQYNVYNYDDYVLLNRYYTANVVQVRIARDLHLKD